MTTDDLSAPLGQGKVGTRRRAQSIPRPPVIAAVLALPVAVFAGVAMLSNDPLGGEPMAVAPVNATTNVAAAPDGAAPVGTPSGDTPTVQAAAPTTPANTRTVTIIDGSNGTRREVVIPATPDGLANSE